VRRVVGVAAMLVLAACTSTETVTSTSLAPLVPPDALPIDTAAPVTSVATSSLPDAPIIVALPEPTCEFAAAPLDGGEITFISGDLLWGATPNGSSVRCLGTLSRGQRGLVQWSPNGQRALLNGSSVLDVDGVRGSGFDPGSPRTRWEFPDGAGLVATSTTGRTVVRRDATNASARTQVEFISRTTALAMHPHGDAIVVGGKDADITGVYASPESDGGPSRTLLTLASPDASISDVAVDAAGDTVYAIVDSPNATEVGVLSALDLSYRSLVTEQAPIAQLTVGPVWRTLAWRTGLCNSTTTTWLRDDRTSTAVQIGTGTPLQPLSVSPIGWLDANRLVVASRSIGCDGLADIWIWNISDGAATLLVKSVEFPATRTVNEPAGPLAITPGAVPPVV